MKTILLSQGFYAIVDDSDFRLVSKLNWHLNKKTNVHLYAKSSKKINGKQIHMHRLIMNANKGEEIDHINHNGLDNRRSNLRIVNSFQNHQNSKKQINSTSTYKGISYDKDHKKWRARIWVDGKKIHLGYFGNEIDAARAYDKAALKYYSEYAYINFNKELTMSTMPFGKYVDYELETIPSDYLSYMLDLPGFIDNNEHLADQMQKELDVRENSNAHFYKRPL